MKICLLGDLHWGARNNSEFFFRRTVDYFDNVFFPYLVKHNIKHVFQLGDTLDNRKFVNIRILRTLRERYYAKFAEYGINLVTLVGNHDVFYKNTNHINSSELGVAGLDNITVVTTPQRFFDKIDVIPWITADNKDAIMEYIERSPAPYLMAHLELNGFIMVTGIECTRGMDAKLFKQYQKVFSGHFHLKSHKGNIQYIGIPYQLTWHDYNDAKGFWIWDIDDPDALQFVENTNPVYHKIVYDDTSVDYHSFDVSAYEDTITKVVVQENNDPVMLDHFCNALRLVVESLEIVSPEDFQIEEDQSDQVDVENPIVTLLSSVDKVQTTLDKTSIKEKISKLHQGALA